MFRLRLFSVPSRTVDLSAFLDECLPRFGENPHFRPSGHKTAKIALRIEMARICPIIRHGVVLKGASTPFGSPSLAMPLASLWPVPCEAVCMLPTVHVDSMCASADMPHFTLFLDARTAWRKTTATWKNFDFSMVSPESKQG